MKLLNIRFAPSPSGYLHIGNIRTILYNFAFSFKNKGNFFLRIEDSNLNIKYIKYIKNILNIFSIFNFNYKKKPFFQSKRNFYYLKFIKKLFKIKKVYFFFDKFKSIPIIKFKNNKKNIFKWKNFNKKIISNYKFKDLIIRRSNNLYLYNFCVVVDDIKMKISHIIRGDDHISNTPNQICLYKSFKKKIPIYYHLPMILNNNGKKLSKKKKSFKILNFIKNNFLPETLLNYISKLGWGFLNKEIYKINNFYNLFNIKNIKKSSSKINILKLNWINKYHLKYSNNIKIFKYIIIFLKNKKIKLKNYFKIIKIINIYKFNNINFKNILNNIKYLYINNNKILSNFKKNKIIFDLYILFFKIIWKKKYINLIINKIINIYKLKNYILNKFLRIIIFKKKNTPSLITIIKIIGKKKILNILYKYF
ncbi:putative glutamyl-tRNA synthetase [Candidatus Zinderia insecticola CARI]|uniref:Putative glutamyl-tRNA synthetase n=1 Tax=Zinderia insecticola (strain CARI) TaxID=871271 RepID=E0TIR4_ZINIC|nr:putative glutamyl-tRNA synthetase [Candidatus Zinderia insecticola CARI]